MPGSSRVERSDGDGVAGLFIARAPVAACTVPDPEPDVVDLVLPALPGFATDPSLAPEERGLLGRVKRAGQWRLVVRFDAAAGWRDAVLPARKLRFAARRRA